MQAQYLARMQSNHADRQDSIHLHGDLGRVHARMRAQATGRQWQPHWWSTRPAPLPNWLERLERGIPLPRLLRR